MIRRGLLALLLAAAPAAAAPAQTVDLSQMAVAPNPHLGLAFPGDKPRNYPAIAAAGIGITRLSVSWGRIEPSEGRFDFAGLDDRITTLQGLGIQPFLTFESDAKWATVPDTQRVRNAQPVDPALWARFVSTVVERYDGDGQADAPGLRAPVRYWQVANEWISDRNKSGGWVGTTDQLIDFIRVTQGAVKSAYPQAIFVLGGVAAFNLDILLVARGGANFAVQQKWGEGSQTRLSARDMRGAQIADIIDGVVVPVLRDSPYDLADAHLYGPEERDAARIDMLRRLSGRPVISAECGGPSLDYGDRYTPEGHFVAVLKRNLGVLAADARFCLWFRLGESRGGTFGNSRTALYSADARPKPGVFAYKLLARLLDDGADVRQQGANQFTIRRGAGDVVTLGWGDAAGGVRAAGARDGADVLCLADAAKGLLTTDAGSCAPDAVVLAGPGLAGKLDP